MDSYKYLAAVYDSLMYDVSYEAWGEYLLSLLSESGAEGKIIEYACGTGAVSARLAKAYPLCCLDVSEEMLGIAKEKLTKQGVRADFVCCDMAEFENKKAYGAAVCAMDGVNYLTGGTDAFFEKVYDNLAGGGVFLFDISSKDKLLNTIGDNFFYDDGDDVTYFWQNRAAENRVTMELSVFVRGIGSDYRRYDETHVQRAFSKDELLLSLEKAGFVEVSCYKFMTKEEGSDECDRLQFVAKKVKKMDKVIKGLLNGEAAVYACDISQMANKMRELHQTLPVATTALGRALAGATLMSSMLKNESDSLTLSINGGGECGTIMATGNARLEMKGCIANPMANVLPKANGDMNVGEAVGTRGFLTVIRDTGLKEPYVGKTLLQTGEIAEDLAYYFLQSEQQPSIVYLNTWVELDFSVINAGGIIVKPLPGCSEETLSLIESAAPRINNYAIYLMGNSVEEVLTKIFAGLDFKVTDTLYPKYHCDCSRERLEQVLIALGEKELRDMIAKDHGASVKCRYCGKEYVFSEEELKKLVGGARRRIE